MVFLLNHLLHSSSPLLLDKVVANLQKLQIAGLAVSPCYFLLTGPFVFLHPEHHKTASAPHMFKSP